MAPKKVPKADAPGKERESTPVPRPTSTEPHVQFQVNPHANEDTKDTGVKALLNKLKPLVVEYGVGILLTIMAVLMVLVIVTYSLYAQHRTDNNSLASRIGELEKDLRSRIGVLERKILIDKDIEKLQDSIKALDSRHSDLQFNVQKLSETVQNLKPKVENLDKTVPKLEHKVTKLNETAVKLEPNVEQLNTIVAKLNKTVPELNETVAKLEPKVKKLDETVVKVTPKVEKLENTALKLAPTVKNLEETVILLEPKVQQVHRMVVIMEPKVEKLNEMVFRLEPKIEKLDTTFIKMESKVEKFNKTVCNLEPKVKILTEIVVKLEPKGKKLQENVNELDGRVEELDRKVADTESLTEDVTSLKSTTSEMHERLYNLGEYSWKKVPESHHRIDTLELSSRSQVTVLWLQLLLTFCVICWSVYNYSQTWSVKVDQHAGERQQPRAGTPPREQEFYRPVRSVLDSIHPSTLANQICVVSFYSETKAFHMRLVESACTSGELNKVDRVSSLVSNHECIPKLPRAKVLLVFVDFNERDIILEHPEREVGDLRMTTVQGARKLGADVFVVYVKDKGSQNLNANQLYNERLRSINIHPELSVLNEKRRVLTTFDEFTMNQRSHLHKCFKNTLFKK